MSFRSSLPGAEQLKFSPCSISMQARQPSPGIIKKPQEVCLRKQHVRISFTSHQKRNRPASQMQSLAEDRLAFSSVISFAWHGVHSKRWLTENTALKRP